MSGWDLFAARQLVRESGGELRCEGQESSEQRVTIAFPVSWSRRDRNLIARLLARVERRKWPAPDQRYWRAMLYLRMRGLQGCSLHPSAPRRRSARRPSPLLAALFMIRSPLHDMRRVRISYSEAGAALSTTSGIAICSVLPLVRMTDRSITFCNSRMLPGQS